MNTTSNAKQGINNLKQAGRDFQNAANSAENTAQEIGSEFAQRAVQAGEEVRRYVNQASDRLSQVGADLEETIHAKPYQSTLMALFAGVVLGMLIKR